MIAVLLWAVFSLSASAEEVYTNWGCPTEAGPISIAKAWRESGDVSAVAEANLCSPFPFIVLVKPVRFVVETEDNDGFFYVWEVRFEDTEGTFFSGFNDAANDIFQDVLKKTSL